MVRKSRVPQVQPGVDWEEDWTVDPQTGQANSSPQFLQIVEVVENLIRDEEPSLIRGDVESVARLIVAYLVHRYELRPMKM